MNLLDPIDFSILISDLQTLGYSEEIEWGRNTPICDNPESFKNETVWVILNSGMKNQVAQVIWQRIKGAWIQLKDISEVFNHKGKVAAIKYIVANADNLFNEYQKADDKISFLKTLPYIGAITCWHLAKNLGLDCVKPDRHLVRVAAQYGLTPDELCGQVAKKTGERKALVDLIIWRASNLQIL